MKKFMQKEISFCDECKREQGYTATCLGCGKEYCFDCRKIFGRSYEHGVSCCGSGDGYFCNICIDNPPDKIKELLAGYREIAAIRAERKAYYDRFEERENKAEGDMKSLIEGFQEKYKVRF